MKKLSTCLLFIFLSTALFAQNGKGQKTPEQAVEEINATLIAQNEDLALNDNQKAEMKDLITQRNQAVADFRKSNKEDKEGLKAIMKEYNTKIYNGTLTKEQMAAYREAKKNNNKKEE